MSRCCSSQLAPMNRLCRSQERSSPCTWAHFARGQAAPWTAGSDESQGLSFLGSLQGTLSWLWQIDDLPDQKMVFSCIFRSYVSLREELSSLCFCYVQFLNI